MGARWLTGCRWAVPALAVAIGVAVPSATSPPVQAGIGDRVVVTFEYTGAAQTWVVPATVSVATFDVYGAQGGSGNVRPARPSSVVSVDGRRPPCRSPLAARSTSLSAARAPTSSTNLPTATSREASTAAVMPDRKRWAKVSAVRGVVGRRTCASAVMRLFDRALVAGGGGGASANLFCPAVGSGGGLSGGSVRREGLCTGGGAGGNQDGTSGSGVLGSGSDGGPFERGLGAGRWRWWWLLRRGRRGDQWLRGWRRKRLRAVGH